MDERGERIAARLEPPLLFAALLTIPALVIEGSSASSDAQAVATVLNWIIWLAFLAEVVIMLALGKLISRVLSPQGLRWAAFLTLLVVIAGAAGFTAVEQGHHKPGINVWDGLWWAVTVTTVGYGDVTVQTDAGRVIAMAIMIAGIGFVACSPRRGRALRAA